MNLVGVDPIWSLHLNTPRSSDNSSSDVNTSVIWSSSATSSQPSAKELSGLLLTESIEPENVTNLAAQIVRNAPVSVIAGLLDKIACVYWRNESDQIDLRMLENLPNANRRTICGNVFKKGEIVWTCRTCAKDPTCVQCDTCFKGSDHTDHEVHFHRASGRGGCCDCGDPEAWSQCGNCNEHKGKNHCGIDPLTVIPPNLLKGSRAVIAGVLGVITSYAVGTVRGFEKYEDNCYVNDAKVASEQGREPSKLKVRLHNDDMHTYDEVTDALIAFNISSSVAQAMTATVDIDGEASVFVGEASDPRIRRASLVFLDRNGLLVSITPEKLANLGPNVAAAFQWLIAFGNGNDGLMRVVTEVLLQETDTLPSCAVAVQSVGIPAPNAIFEESAELDSKGELKEQQFPLSVQHNRVDAPLRLDEDELSRTLRIAPFSLCPRSSLAVLVLASPYLSPSLSKAINDLVILYQQDATFKGVFSQVMTLLYPALYGLYFRAVGLAKETVFSTTVQVYTADSIVTMMSSEGVSDRPLQERKGSRFIPASAATAPTPSSSSNTSAAVVVDTGDAALITRSSAYQAPVNLMEILTSTFLVLLADVGCVADRDDDNFVTHHSIRKRRYGHLCRDLEYCSDNPWAAIKTLQGIRDARVVQDWLEICALLQCMYRFKRRTGTHQEQEDYKWQDAANLVLQLETVSSTFMCNALLAPITPYDPKRAAGIDVLLPPGTDLTDVSVHRMYAVEVALRKAFSALESWFFAQMLHPCEDHDLFFNSSGGYYLIAVLGCPVDFPGIRRYTVSHSLVSVHLPIHRFISKMMDFAAYADLGLSETISRLVPTLAFTLADFPLRCLSFCAQVRAGMWRRNGSMAENLAFNYDRPPLCKSLRNTDLTSIQTAIIAMGPDTTLALAIDRYEMTSFLESFFESPNPQLSADKLLEYRGPLLADLLKTVILLMTYLPGSLVPKDISEAKKQAGEKEDGRECRISTALKRELSHLLLAGDQSMSISNLQKAKSMIGSTEMVTDKMMRSAVEELCDRREDLLAGKKTLDLRVAAFNLFDPEYLNLSSQKQQLATDRVREQRKKTRAASTPASGVAPNAPVITHLAVPTPHRDYVKARRLLFQPLTCRVLESCLRCCAAESKVLGGSMNAVINRVIHIATLQLHCQAEVAAFDLQEESQAAETETVLDEKSSKNETDGKMDVEGAPSPSVEGDKNSKSSSGSGAAGCFYDLFFTAASTADTAPASSTDTGTDASTGTPAEVQKKSSKNPKYEGAGRSFLTALADIWLAGMIRDDEYYHQGLSWVLKELSARSKDACTLLLQKGITFENALAAQSSRDAIAKRRQDAQRRAVSAMTKQAASFATALKEDDDDEDELDGQPAESQAAPSLEDGAPECIFCREKSGDAMGYLAFLQTSSVMKKAVQRHSDCKEMQSVYRVVSYAGCNITLTASETSRVLAHVPQGGHVLVGCKAGRWMRIVSPTPGWMPLYLRLPLLPKPQDQRTASVEGRERYQRLLFEKPSAPPPTLEVVLHPVTDLQFNHFGGERVHVSSCGHAMHLKCHSRVLESMRHDSRFATNYEDHQVIDVKRGELLCPLCKGIGNCILPYTPPHIAATRLPMHKAAPAPTSSGFNLPASTHGERESLSSLLSHAGQEKASSSSLSAFVKSLLPPMNSSPQGMKGPPPAPVPVPPVVITGVFAADVAAAAKAASSAFTLPDTSNPAGAYDRVVSDSLFQKEILSHFIPHWHYDSHAMQRTSVMVKPGLARSTHSSWAAAAYTLLCSSRAKSWLDVQSPTQQSAMHSVDGILNLAEDEKNITLIYQLLLFLRTVDPALYKHNSAVLHSGLIGPLGDLLSGCSPLGTPFNSVHQVYLNRNDASCMLCSNPRPHEVRSALMSQPLASVGTVSFPDPKRQSTIMKHGLRLLAEEAEVVDSAASITESDLWPFLRTPLLEHDLHVIAIAFVTTAVDLTAAIAALPVICLARLAQILIEPAASGMASANSKAALSLLEADSARYRSRKKNETDPATRGKSDSEPRIAPPRVMVIDQSSLYTFTKKSDAGSELKNGLDRDSSDSSSLSSSRKREREECRTQQSLLREYSFEQAPSELELSEQLSRLQKSLLSSLDVHGQLDPSSSTSSTSSAHGGALDGVDLLSSVIDSWLPFLEFCCSLRVVLMSKSPASAGVKSSPSRDTDELAPQLLSNINHLLGVLRVLGLVPASIVSPSTAASSSSTDTKSVLKSLSGSGWSDNDIGSLHQLLTSPGLISMFDAWGSQAANDSLSPAVPPFPSPSSSWMPAISAGTKSPAAALSPQAGGSGEKSAAALRESPKSGTEAEAEAEAEEPSHSVRTRGEDEMSEEEDECNFSDDEDEYSNPHSHNENEDDGDDDDEDDGLDLYDMDGEDADGDGDDDDEFEDQHFQEDNWIEDALEGGNLNFFEQQMAGFMNNNPGLVDGELPADMGGMMADVMEQLGMQPDEALPPGLAAIFETLQGSARVQTAAGGRTVWRMIGVDPVNLHVDAHLPDLYNAESPAIHTMAPLRGSVTGRAAVYGLSGQRLSEGYCDLSHFGLGNRHRGGFVPLPLVYTDLHHMTTFPDSLPGQSVDEPALCLLCGQILNVGIPGLGSGTDSTPPGVGECTLHARTCGAGVGVFFLVHKCSVLLMRGSRTCLYPSIYLDQNGDEPDFSAQMSPMFLSQKNVRRLEELYLNHHIAREVIRRRAS